MKPSQPLEVLGPCARPMREKVDTLNYKTIRYPGHGKLMRFLMYEMVMKKDLKELEKILTNAKPPVEEDLVHVYAVVEGKIDGEMHRKEFFRPIFLSKSMEKFGELYPGQLQHLCSSR